MGQKKTIRKIRDARKNGLLPKRFRSSDLVKIGIPQGTARTFPWKHCVDRDKKYEKVKKYFVQNEDGSYSLLEENW